MSLFYKDIAKMTYLGMAAMQTESPFTLYAVCIGMEHQKIILAIGSPSF